jgi:hypothetical protein
MTTERDFWTDQAILAENTDYLIPYTVRLRKTRLLQAPTPLCSRLPVQWYYFSFELMIKDSQTVEVGGVYTNDEAESARKGYRPQAGAQVRSARLIRPRIF